MRVREVKKGVCVFAFVCFVRFICLFVRKKVDSRRMKKTCQHEPMNKNMCESNEKKGN